MVQKKKIWQLVCLLLAVWGVVKITPGIFGNLMCRCFSLKANFFPSDASTVGIIGGADGPTAIFITGPGWSSYVLPVLAIVIGVLGYVKLQKIK